MNLRAVLGGALMAMLAVDVQDAAIFEGRRLALVELDSVVSNRGCSNSWHALQLNTPMPAVPNNGSACGTIKDTNAGSAEQ